MKTLCYAFLLGFIVPYSAEAEPIKSGSNIENAEVEMKSFGYERGALNRVHVDQMREFIGLPKRDDNALENLKQWRVGQGYLLISYVVSTGSVTTLSFYLMEPRFSADAAGFRLDVSSFDPSSGKMVIETKETQSEN